MKLLFVVSHYYPYTGGVEYVVKSVAERLAKRGHDVTVLCGESNIEKPCDDLVNSVFVVRWPVYAPGDAYYIPKMRHELKDRLLGIVKECDAVHFHSVHSVLAIFSLGVLSRSKARRVLTPYYHGTGHTFFRKILWKGWRFHVRHLIRFVDVVHTVSKLEAQLVRRDFKVDAIPIENGVDEWLLDLQWSPSGYVMYSGRIEKYKNIHRLANIVKILSDNYGLNLKLKVYGSGPYINSISRRLEKIGIEYSVNPPQPFEKYVETLSKASLFGLLSEKESYPQSVNEANAIGVPTVVVEPWGMNFSGRNKTLITQLDKSDETIAHEIKGFLELCRSQPKTDVLGWDRVSNIYIERLYRS
ncbi:MAG: glycosyltransferase family 4 protein [Candidatus Jordarchaeales archaeon]